MRRMVSALRAVLDDEAGRSLPQVADAEAATAHMKPLEDELGAELDEGARASLKSLQQQAASKQQAWLQQESELSRYAIKGSEADWESALNTAKGGGAPKELSVKGEKREYTPASKDKKAKHKGGKDASAKRKRSQ
ncbi:MAG: hypothetical protein SGPRY_004632 [Prymnesium sp.]